LFFDRTVSAVSMSCYLCGSERHSLRPGTVRDNPAIQVLECEDCGLVYLSSQSHIADGHYENSGMHSGKDLSIGTWLEESRIDDERRYEFLKKRMTERSLLDFGCGNGGFLNLAKESASVSVGIELEKALQPSFKSRGLTVYPNLDVAKEQAQQWDLITAFHVVEHLFDPLAILQQLSTMLSEKGEIIIEVPSSDDALLTLYENEAFQNFTYWSQHLFLFNANTMQRLIAKAGLKLNWIEHVQRYSLANHLYWLAKGKPGGHEKWVSLNDDELNAQYERQLASIGRTDTIIASISI